MFHTPSGRCLVALCFVLRWSATAAARPFSTATNLEPDEQEIKPVEQEINPSFDVDTYDTCELSEGLYTMSNLSEILCASGQKKWKDIIEMHPNSSKKLVLEPTKPLRLVGKGEEQTTLEFDISLLPGANLSLKALHLEGRIEALQDETSSGQSKMSYLTFVNCSVKPPAPDAKQKALAKLDQNGFHDPFPGDASGWWGWLMLRDAALTLQIQGSHLYGGAFVKQSTHFSLLASNSSFDLQGQGFQLFNVTSHIQLEEVEVWTTSNPEYQHHPSFQMLNGRPKLHVAGSTFYGSAIHIKEPVDLILDVGGNTRFRGGPRVIVVDGGEADSLQVGLQDVEINAPGKEIKHVSEIGVGASEVCCCIFSLPVRSKRMCTLRF